MKKMPQFKHGLNVTLPEGTKLKQELKPIMPGYIGMNFEGAHLRPDGNAAHLLRALDSIFRKAGFIAEGMLIDLVWGLQQSADFKQEWIGPGLTELRMKGFIFYTDDNYNKLSDIEFLQQDKPIWVRYSPKLLQLCKTGRSVNENSGSK